MRWLDEERLELAAQRILDAAGELFVERGVGTPGMDEVARAAGCSRATLYRYFPNRQALLLAFAHREAQEVTAQAAEAIADVDDPHERAVGAVLACLTAVRERPHLRPWYADDGAVLRDVLRESPLIRAFADGSLSRGAPDPDLADWVLRIILSFLTDPGADDNEERRLLTRFLHLSPAPG